MMAANSKLLDAFQWMGNTGEKASESSVARQRKVAEALGAKYGQRLPQNAWEGIDALTAGFVSGELDRRNNAAEQSGREEYNAAFGALGENPDHNALMGISGMDFGNDNQEGIVQALLAQSMMPKKAPDPFTLGKNEVRYDGAGNIVATGPEGGPDTVVENNLGGSDKFYENLDAAAGKSVMETINAGLNAQSNNARLGQLKTLLETAPQGATGVVTQFAGSLGIPMDGLDDLQAAQALINQLVPGQRAPGSGTMSDADLALFKQSLPAIINQPGGNQIILETAMALNEYQIAQAEIANKVANREISPAEGRTLQAQIPNTLADFKVKPDGASDVVVPKKYPGVTIKKVSP